MSYYILQDRFSISEKIKKLFSYRTRNRRRVILINYLDAIAPNFLIDVHNVNIFCYPQPGNIDPYALEELLDKGANIYFTGPINMNLFYVENEGVLIGSANYNLTLSTINDVWANIQDIIIFLEDYFLIDIDRIVDLLDKKLITKDDLEIFKEKHHVFWRIYEGFESYTNLLSCLTKNIFDEKSKPKSSKRLRSRKKRLENIIEINNCERAKDFNQKAISLKPDDESLRVNDKKINDASSNIYTISKSDLLEIIMERMSKPKTKLH